MFLGGLEDPATQIQDRPFALGSLADLVFHLIQLSLVFQVGLVAQGIQENLLALLALEGQCLVLQNLPSFL